MHLSSHVYRKLGLLVIGGLVISALAAGPALARGPRPSGSAQCQVTPNPVSNDVAGTFTIFGTGFAAGAQVSMFVGGGTILMAVTDSTGSFSVWSWAQFLADGTNDVYVGYAGDRHGTVQAHCSVLVL